MKMIVMAAWAAASVALAGCGEQKTSTGPAVSTEADGNSPEAAAAETHTGTGTVDSVSGNQVTISHEEIKSIGWPAMTMPFTAADAAALKGIKTGDRVAFAFRHSGGTSTLSSISKQ